MTSMIVKTHRSESAEAFGWREVGALIPIRVAVEAQLVIFSVFFHFQGLQAIQGSS